MHLDQDQHDLAIVGATIIVWHTLGWDSQGCHTNEKICCINTLANVSPVAIGRITYEKNTYDVSPFDWFCK